MNQSLKAGILLGTLGVFAFGAAAWADGMDATVKGELVDTVCYVTMGAKGASHAQCATECAKAGAPVGIVEEGSGKLYTLLPSKDKTSVVSKVGDKMGKTVTVKGDKYEKGGSQYLTVESVS